MAERASALADGPAPGAAPTRAGTTGATIALAVAVLALPSAVLGFGTKFQAPRDKDDALHIEGGEVEGTTMEGTGARLARALSLSFLGRAPLYPFTPAKNPNRPDRSITVAVLDSRALKTISVLGPKTEPPAAPDASLRIAPTGFNLGVARGYRNFAPDLPPAPTVRRPDAVDISRYSLAPRGPTLSDTRYALHPPADDRGDAGSSYRVLRNLNLTAGVHSLQDRERVKSLNDANPDNQAVYVGTQFRF